MGLPLVEQQEKTLTVGIMVGTTNVPAVNGIEVPHPGPFQFNYTLASGSNASNAVELVQISSRLLTARPLSPGELFPYKIDDLRVSLSNYGCDEISLLCVEIISEQPLLTLTGSPKGCIQITCRGVVITYVDPVELQTSTLNQGVPNNNVRLTVSFESDPNYASVSGEYLWDPNVFGNGNQFGTKNPRVDGMTTLTAVSNYGINSMATSVWPELGVMIDLSDYGCPEARFICVNPRRNSSSTVQFSLSFIPMSAQYGCAEVECAGVEFIGGTLSTNSKFAEFRSMHEISFSGSFESDPSKGGVQGHKLWRVKGYASNTNDTGSSTTSTPISEATTLADNVIDQDLSPGASLSWVGTTFVILDLSTVSCSSLVYFCILAERNPDSQRKDLSPLNFDVNSYIVCEQIECVGLEIDTLTLTHNADQGDPLRELVTGNQDFYLDLTIDPLSTSGGVSGNWTFDVYFSDMQDCSSTPTSLPTITVVPSMKQIYQDVDGQLVTIEGIQVKVDLSRFACSSAPYMCLNLTSASSMSQAITGETTASLRYNCKGINLVADSVVLNNMPVVTERAQGVTFDVDLNVIARSDGGGAIDTITGPLWTASFFFSPNQNGNPMELQSSATTGQWASIDVPSARVGSSADTPTELSSIPVTINLDSTCANMQWLCVQLDNHTNALFTFEVSSSDRTACLQITECHGVEIEETNVAIADPSSITVIENTPTILNPELVIDGQAAATSASISGINLWSLEIFTSSDGMSKDGGVNFLETLTSNQEETAITTAGASFNFTDDDLIDITFNMSNQPCALNNYLCVEIMMGMSPEPTFTLEGNTTACVNLNCKGIIVTDTVNNITSIPNGGVLVEGFSNQAVNLEVTLTTDGSGAEGSGTGLWQLDVFTNAFENGTGVVKQFDASLTTGSWIDTAVPAGTATSLTVPVMVDLSGQLCMDVNYLCVRIREGVNPSPMVTLQYSTGPENFIGCAPVTCETAGIERNGFSFTPMRVVEHQVDPQPFDISVSYISEPGRDNITGADLWSLTVFFSDSENGTNPAVETKVDLGSLTDAPFYSGQTLNFTNLNVNVSLEDFTCYMPTYLCSQLAKGNPLNDFYTLEIRPDCQPIQCAGIALNSTEVSINSGQLLFEFQSSQSSSLDVTLYSLQEGASVEGTDLWNFTVFLSNSDTMFTNRKAVLTTTTYTSSGSPLEAGTPLSVTGLTSQLDLEGVGCVDFQYICVEVDVGIMAVPSFNVDLQRPDANIGCAPVDCRGVVISSANLDVSDGNILIERVDEHNVTFSVSLQFSDDSTDVYGTDLWQATIFTNSGEGCSDTPCASAIPVALNGNVTRGQMVTTESATVSLDVSQCTCPEMQYLCLLITMNPDAGVNFTLEIPAQGFRDQQKVTCTGAVIDDVSLLVTNVEPVILIEGDTLNVTANVNLTVADVSASIDASVTNIWQIELYPASDPMRYRVPATLTTEQRDQGFNASDVLKFDDLFFEFGTRDFVCPEGDFEDLCIQVSASPSITPAVSIAIYQDGIVCITVPCRGVAFDNLIVDERTDSSFVEFESMHRIIFNISANTTELSINIPNGINLWQVRVYGSLYMNGTGERYSETHIPIADSNAMVTAGTPVEYTGLVWDMDLTNFTCPSSNQFFMCVQLMPGNTPVPPLSISPSPLLTCVEIECTGVYISTLDLTVNSGDPVSERRSNDINLSVTATSSAAGSSINGDDLWKLTILICENDNCAASARRRRATNPNALVEILANLTAASVNEDLAAGGSITFSDIAVTFDLVDNCPDTEIIYLCVQLDRGDTASPDYTLQGDLLTCQPLQCRGVHIQSSITANEIGSLQEGNPSNAVELDFSFTADTVTSNVSGTNLWDIEIFGSDMTGETPGTLVVFGDIGSTTNAPLSAGQTIEFFRVTATLDLSPYLTCQDTQYVCGRLARRATASQEFSVTGEKTACFEYPCTGVLVSATSVEITNDASPTEGQAINIELNVSLAINPDSSNLSSVSDAWHIQVFGDPQMNGLGGGGPGWFTTNTTSVGDVGAMPGTSSELNPVSLSFDLTNGYCANVNYLCVAVQRGGNAMPPFKLGGVPSDIDGLYACTAVDCIGVRINSSSIETITEGDPILQGNASFNVEIDVDYTSDESGAHVSGTNIFGVKIFLSNDGSANGIIGDKYTADIPEASQSTTLMAGQQLNILRAVASISTVGLSCPPMLYLCAELFKPGNASYLLNGYDSSMGTVDDSILSACEIVECRDVRFDDMTLSTIDPPCVVERTAGQILSVNVTVESNSSWSSAIGTNLWIIDAIINSSQEVRMESAILSMDNANRDVLAGSSTTFPNVELSLDLSTFYCRDTMVELCVSFATDASSGFSLSSNSVMEVCLDVPCKVTEIDSSDYEIFFPPNILELETVDLRFAVSLTSGPLSTAVDGDELWRIVRVYMSGYAEGNDSVAVDTTVPLLSSQDEVGISAGETIRLLNIQASLNLQDVDCASMPYLCVEVAQGETPSPEFNVSFNDNSNIICKENVRCQGIVITNNSIQSPPQGPDATEGDENQAVNITLVVEHDPELGTSTGAEMYPWMVTIFYNSRWDCMGDDFGDRVAAGLVDHQMLIDDQELVLENLDVDVNLTQLVCPQRDIYLCAEFNKNASRESDFTLDFQSPSVRYAMREVACHGVEISSTNFTLTDGIQHEQGDANHEITFSFAVTTSETSRPLSGADLWSFLIYGSRNEDGSGDRVINYNLTSDLSAASIQPDGTYELDPTSQMVNLSFDDIECIEMPYLCMRIQKSGSSSIDFSLWGVPNDLILQDCFMLDCRGVYIDEFNVSLTAGDEIIYENRANELTAINLDLSSRMDKESVSGSNLWEIFTFFSDTEDGSGEVIDRTQIAPLPDNQDDQDFIAGGEISFGPLDTSLTLSGTCENVMYLCFELRANDAAVVPDTIILLGMRVSCVPIDCRGVIVSRTTLQVDPTEYTETIGPIDFVATATVTPHLDSADISGTSLWNLDFYLSDSPNGNTSFARAPLLSSNEPLSVGSNVEFSNVRPVFNASEVLCYEALYLCMVLKKNSGANPDFGLKGLPDDGTLLDCVDVSPSCIGVVVAETDLGLINSPVLLSGEPNMELGPLSIDVTFATLTRAILDGNNLFSFLILARDGAGQDIELDRRPQTVPTSNVQSLGMIQFPFQSLVVDLTGIRCDQMTSICGVFQKGSDPEPDFTLQGQGLDMMLLEDCVDLQCRGVRVESLFINFMSGLPLLELTASHEVNFTLTVASSSMGASAVGEDLWSLTTFLSRYENGSNPISAKTAYIGSDANMDLAAGQSIDIAASVNLNTSDLVCDSEFFLCVVLSKGDGVNPDYTLEGDLQVCRSFVCNGVNLTNANVTISSDDVLRNFDPMSELTVDVSVDVIEGSSTVTGRDLWHFEFFTSTDSAGNVSPSPRATADNLTAEQGSVSLNAGETSTISGVIVYLDLSSISCDTPRYLCVEVWRGDRAFPFYSISNLDSQTQLRTCRPIECAGVKFVSVTPVVITPLIWIEELANQTIALEVILMPDPARSGIVGENLFQVDVFASASNTGTEGEISPVTVPVSNAYASNLRVDRLQNNTLVNIQALVDFTGRSCSELSYIFVRVRKGTNAMPNYLLEGEDDLLDDSNLGFALQPCAGIIVNSVIPTLNLGSNNILEGDSAHTFSFSVDVSTGNGIITDGTNEDWQLEVFVSLFNDGRAPLRNVLIEDLSSPSSPDSQIVFSDLQATLNLSGLGCDQFRYFCARLSAPGANFTLMGAPTESSLLGCVSSQLTCLAINLNLRLQVFTDTTLTVEWEPSIGDFDSYLLAINPREGPNPEYSQIKSLGTYMHTFTGLTPGNNYTVSIQLTKGGVQKGAANVLSQTTLYPSCPALEVPTDDVTSTEITVTWPRPEGCSNVVSYSLSIAPDTDVTFISDIANPFTCSSPTADAYRAVFSSLTPAQSYVIEVRANARYGPSSPPGCNSRTVVAKPGAVELQVNAFNSTSVSLGWNSPLSVTPDGYMLTIDILSAVPDAAPAPVDFPGTDTAYVVSSLLPGVEYSFTIQAYQSVQAILSFGIADTVTQRTTPVPPQNIVIDAAETSVTITYEAPPGFHSSFIHSLLDVNENLLNGPNATYEFTVEYTGLTAGTLYTYRVLTMAGSATSETIQRTFTSRPSPPREPQTIFVDESTITIVWEHNIGQRDEYQVSYTPMGDNTQPQSPQALSENRFTLTGIDPYTTIDFNVTTIVNSVHSIPATWRQRTVATRPDPVQNLMLVVTSPSSVNVIFNVPDKPNGFITGYLISYIGTRSDGTISSGNQIFSDIHPNDVRIEVLIANLDPGVVYEFFVQAVNDEGTSDAESGLITLVAGDPVPSGNTVSNLGQTVSSTATTITIVITDNLFSDVNGFVIAFQVFVVEDHASITDRTISDPPRRYQEVRNLPIRLVYVTSPLFAPTPRFSGRRKRQIADTRTSFTIGTETECVSEDSICNGPLEPLTSYRILVRAYTDGGFADSPWSDPISTKVLDSWFTIPIIIYGVIIFFIMIFLILCCLSAGRHRRKKVKSSPGPRKARGFHSPKQESRFNDNHNNSSYRHPKHSKAPPAILSRPVLSSQFALHYNEMIANKQHKFTLEFDDLRNIGQDLSKSEGRHLENKNKNRFGNILPYNETRVSLSGSQDYINASFISGFNKAKEYITTQGPMTNTVNEFWRMVWEKECPAIVMLVRCIEGGKEKCDKYWPVSADPTVFGQVIVTKLAEHNHDSWAIRDFRLKVGNEERLLRQYHFIAWPTHSTPKVSRPVLSFVKNIRDELASAKLKGPLVIHCGAGIGRSGVFIALDILLQELKADDRTVDVFAVVAKMRRERCSMVQSLVQYIFLHRALGDYLRGHGHVIEASSIEGSDVGSIQSDEIEEMSNTSL
ncbi:uncharacterized protein LOC129263629 [Lytechinus pictus]|uniref:uncharacterized protein LOC129263629 n=1 Tax=Lytechinus pictus TaxID=7653 RepID=UPI0030B9FD03